MNEEIKDTGNELLIPQFPVVAFTEDDKTWGEIVTASSYLPYILLYGGNSNACKEGKINIGHYGLVAQKDNIADLGKEFDCLPISFRFKAMEVIDGGILNKYNPNDPSFALIREKSSIKDSGCMFGVEFLFWVPNPPAHCFATFFCNSKTSRREAPNIKSFCATNKPLPGLPNGHGPLPATMKAQLIKTEKYMWHGPVVTKCSTEFPIPEMDEILEVATKFANPKDSEVEAVEPGSAARDR